VFHRIYESMGLGMHPTSLCPRRNRIAPTGGPLERYSALAFLTPIIVGLRAESVKRFCCLELTVFLP